MRAQQVSGSGSGRFNEVLEFDEVQTQADLTATEGMLIVDVWGVGASEEKLVGKLSLSLASGLPMNKSKTFSLITGSIELKASMALSEVQPSSEVPTGSGGAASEEGFDEYREKKRGEMGVAYKAHKAAPPKPKAELLPPTAPKPPKTTPQEAAAAKAQPKSPPKPSGPPRAITMTDTISEKRVGLMSDEEKASFEFRGQRARPRKKIEYAPIKNTTYLKPPGSCNTKWFGGGKSVGVEVECVEDSELYILDACEQVQIAECKNCRCVVAPTSGSVFLMDCENCVFSIAAKQIRLRDCKNCELRVFVPNRDGLIVETSENNTIAQWDITYPELSAQFTLSKIDEKAKNMWNTVYDFSPEVGAKKHWTLKNTPPKMLRLVPHPEGWHGGTVDAVDANDTAAINAALAKTKAVDVTDGAGGGSGEVEEYLDDYEDDFEQPPAPAAPPPPPPAPTKAQSSTASALNKSLQDYDDADEVVEDVLEEDIIEEDDFDDDVDLPGVDSPSKSKQAAASSTSAVADVSDPVEEEDEDDDSGSPRLLARAAAAAAKDKGWAASVHSFVHSKVLTFNPSYAGQIITAHTRFQEIVEEALERVLNSTDGINAEELMLALIGTSADQVVVPPKNRAAALEILSLDSMEAFEELLREEAKAAKADPVRRAGLAALATPDWIESVKAFVGENMKEFQKGGGSHLSWTTRHEEFQEACEPG